MHTPRHQRGYILIVTMMLLLILTMTAALVFEQSNSGVEVSIALKTQSVAQARASMGVMQMRAQSLSQVASMLSLPVCTKANAEMDSPLQYGPDPVTGLPVPCRLVLQKGADANGLVTFAVNPTTLSSELDEGAGEQYRVILYNQGPGTGTAGRYYIISTGYYGLTGSPNRKESQIVVETTLPSGVKEKPCETGMAGTC